MLISLAYLSRPIAGSSLITTVQCRRFTCIAAPGCESGLNYFLPPREDVRRIAARLVSYAMTTPGQWWRPRQWWARLRGVRLSRRNGILAAASAAVVVALVTVLVVATSGGHGKKLAGATATTPTPTPTHTKAAPARPKAPPPKPKPKPKPINPLTGEAPSSHSVVAVKIDDTGNGRPQRGIDKADIV